MPQAQPVTQPMAPRPAPQPAMPPVQEPSLAAFDTDPSHYDMDGQGIEAEDEDTAADAAFIPPAPQAPARIPRVEDFPPVVQRQIEARQSPQRPAHEDRGPMSLLRRLASVGLGRREEGPADHSDRQPAQVQRPAARPAQPQQRQIPPQPRAAQPQSRAAAKDGMYRPAEGNLDPHGRPQPAQRPQEDELKMPAVLRRQAN
jgi:cell division protein FtsZ